MISSTRTGSLISFFLAMIANKISYGFLDERVVVKMSHAHTALKGCDEKGACCQLFIKPWKTGYECEKNNYLRKK